MIIGIKNMMKKIENEVEEKIEEYVNIFEKEIEIRERIWGK